MNNDLELYHNLLFINRPWLDNTTSEQKFRQLLHELPQENLAQQPIYELVFPKPLTAKQKYYCTLLNNEANRYINNIHSLINQASNDNEKKFWVNTTLYKKLKDKLTQTETVIKKNNFFLTDINDKNQQQEHLDNTYIIQNLKYQLIRLYLELQNSFPAYVKEDMLNEEDIHKLYFGEPSPDKSFIVPAANYNFPKAKQPLIIQDEIKFQPIRADFGVVPKGILKYSDVIKTPDKFSVFETELFHQELINQQYKFSKRHGQVLELAAAYQILIKKKYFNDYYFPGRKKIADLHIRKFLNNRYSANIDREFRNFNNSKLLEKYIQTKLWLTLII